MYGAEIVIRGSALKFDKRVFANARAIYMTMVMFGLNLR